MKRLSRVLAWVLVFGIVALSIVPPDDRVVTDLPRLLEHLSIFLLAGLAFGLGYPDRYPLQTIAFFAASLELVQVWVPGRHARLSDFAAGVVGLSLGTGLAYVSTRMARQKRGFVVERGKPLVFRPWSPGEPLARGCLEHPSACNHGGSRARRSDRAPRRLRPGLLSPRLWRGFFRPDIRNN